MKILNVVGARPNFMKIGPLMTEYRRHKDIQTMLVHTGQHYDQAMSRLFFNDLGIPQPDVNLEVGSASHAIQTAEIMKRFEPVLIDYKPNVVVVVGDVNSTIACGLVAVKLGIALAHVEAGLRSFDRSMPEEINRILTDSISNLLFCTEQSGVDNLLKEGISKKKIHMVGHVMIDTLLRNKERAEKSNILNILNLIPENYAVVTLHRPSNVDDPEVFSRILDALAIIQKDIPIIFPVHPRTNKNIKSDLYSKRIKEITGLRLIEPLGYLDFLKLMSNAKVVLTDSGGIQEETTILKIPCLTLRDNTERPVTTKLGTNQIVGTNPNIIIKAYKKALDGGLDRSKIPPLWDGKAAQRIVRILMNESL